MTATRRHEREADVPCRRWCRRLEAAARVEHQRDAAALGLPRGTCVRRKAQARGVRCRKRTCHERGRASVVTAVRTVAAADEPTTALAAAARRAVSRRKRADAAGREATGRQEAALDCRGAYAYAGQGLGLCGGCECLSRVGGCWLAGSGLQRDGSHGGLHGKLRGLETRTQLGHTQPGAGDDSCPHGDEAVKPAERQRDAAAGAVSQIHKCAG